MQPTQSYAQVVRNTLPNDNSAIDLVSPSALDQWESEHFPTNSTDSSQILEEPLTFDLNRINFYLSKTKLKQDSFVTNQMRDFELHQLKQKVKNLSSIECERNHHKNNAKKLSSENQVLKEQIEKLLVQQNEYKNKIKSLKSSENFKNKKIELQIEEEKLKKQKDDINSENRFQLARLALKNNLMDQKFNEHNKKIEAEKQELVALHSIKETKDVLEVTSLCFKIFESEAIKIESDLQFKEKLNKLNQNIVIYSKKVDQYLPTLNELQQINEIYNKLIFQSSGVVNLVDKLTMDFDYLEKKELHDKTIAELNKTLQLIHSYYNNIYDEKESKFILPEIAASYYSGFYIPALKAIEFKSTLSEYLEERVQLRATALENAKNLRDVLLKLTYVKERNDTIVIDKDNHKKNKNDINNKIENLYVSLVEKWNTVCQAYNAFYIKVAVLEAALHTTEMVIPKEESIHFDKMQMLKSLPPSKPNFA